MSVLAGISKDVYKVSDRGGHGDTCDHNAPDLDAISLGEIRDDLLRQVTADPFLEAERRKALQSKVLELPSIVDKSQEEGIDSRRTSGFLDRYVVSSGLLGLLAALITGGAFLSVPRLVQRSGQQGLDVEKRLLTFGISEVAILFLSIITTVVLEVFDLRPPWRRRDRDDWR